MQTACLVGPVKVLRPVGTLNPTVVGAHRMGHAQEVDHLVLGAMIERGKSRRLADHLGHAVRCVRLCGLHLVEPVASVHVMLGRCYRGGFR